MRFTFHPCQTCSFQYHLDFSGEYWIIVQYDNLCVVVLRFHRRTLPLILNTWLFSCSTVMGTKVAQLQGVLPGSQLPCVGCRYKFDRSVLCQLFSWPHGETVESRQTLPNTHIHRTYNGCRCKLIHPCVPTLSVRLLTEIYKIANEQMQFSVHFISRDFGTA